MRVLAGCVFPIACSPPYNQRRPFVCFDRTHEWTTRASKPSVENLLGSPPRHSISSPAQVAEGCKDTLALPLLGVPLGVKDNLCTEGVPTTAASRILEGYRPSYDASVVSKLKMAGGIAVSVNPELCSKGECER